MNWEEKLAAALRQAQAELNTFYDELLPMANHARHEEFWDRESLLADWQKAQPPEPPASSPLPFLLAGLFLGSLLAWPVAVALLRWLFWP